MNYLRKRVFALGMALCLCLSLCAVSANAADTGEMPVGKISLSLRLTTSNGGYKVVYTAKTTAVDWLAQAAALNKDDPRMANLRFTCKLHDTLTEKLGSVGDDGYTVDIDIAKYENEEILIPDAPNAAMVSDGWATLRYKFNPAVLRTWKGDTAANVKTALQQQMRITATKDVPAAILEGIDSTIHTTAQIDITMTKGKIPLYNEDAITAAFGEIDTGSLTSMDNFFVDVPTTEYYYDAVLWAAENGITNGVDADHFGPEISVTRAQVVTFLWRAAGCPEPKGDASKFADLLDGKYYAKAVAWAIEQGITKGTSNTAFSPDMICTRGQIATFLARFAGAEDADAESVFADVLTTDFFAASVKWAKENGVTEGTSDTTFEPYTNCSRAQVVTFLYRWMVK